MQVTSMRDSDHGCHPCWTLRLKMTKVQVMKVATAEHSGGLGGGETRNTAASVSPDSCAHATRVLK